MLLTMLANCTSIEKYRALIEEKWPERFKILELFQGAKYRLYIKIECNICHTTIDVRSDTIPSLDEPCPDCRRRMIVEKWLKRFREKYPSTQYQIIKVNGQYNIQAICPIHNTTYLLHDFTVQLETGAGCKKCRYMKIKRTQRIDKSIWLERFQQCYGSTEKFRYDFGEDYDAQTPINVKCLKCGMYFRVTPENHCRGFGCPRCGMSYGERVVSKILNAAHIEYISEYGFGNCRSPATEMRPNGMRLRFDFYLPQYNTCIEFDGLQHFEAIKAWGGEDGLLTRQMLDQIKTDYCKDHNIMLLRIKYNQIDIAQSLIMEALKEHDSTK